ncbi:MAG: NADH-quinone oxidoreductase subunit H [Candidatus Hydrogenedentota bacterium]|nr:MAG: NADH-quinone oxidoreductase subunit H [Candidatus Hydrogenedentota bacterium]
MISTLVAGKLTPLLGTGPAWFVTGILFAAIFLAIAAGFAAVAVYAERKIASFIQCRLGPMEVGPHRYEDLPFERLLPAGLGRLVNLLLRVLGFFLSLLLFPFTRRIGMPPGWYGLGTLVGDGVKLLGKEDIIPREADSELFRLAPYIVFTATLAVFAVIPFGEGLVAARFDAGLLYLLAVSSLGVIGIVVGGYASNNKWSLYGAMRSVAQVVSYEVPMGLALLSVCVSVGSFDLVAVARAQRGWIWNWHILSNPFLLLAGVVFLFAALAETNRTPFDIPEAESELVSGYNTEYSGMRFALFFLAEYANMLVAGLVASLFFLGAYSTGLPYLDSLRLLQPFVLLAKAVLVVLLMIVLRWTLPRYRVDRLMTLCWKGLLPLALIALFGVSLVAAQETLLSASRAWKAAWFLITLAFLSSFLLQTRKGLGPMPARTGVPPRNNSPQAAAPTAVVATPAAGERKPR